MIGDQLMLLLMALSSLTGVNGVGQESSVTLEEIVMSMCVEGCTAGAAHASCESMIAIGVDVVVRVVVVGVVVARVIGVVGAGVDGVGVDGTGVVGAGVADVGVVVVSGVVVLIGIVVVGVVTLGGAAVLVSQLQPWCCS